MVVEGGVEDVITWFLGECSGEGWRGGYWLAACLDLVGIPVALFGIPVSGPALQCPAVMVTSWSKRGDT